MNLTKQKFLNEVLNQNVWFEGKQVAEILGYIAALAIPKETGNNLPSVSEASCLVLPENCEWKGKNVF